jgi:hypothetical protein
MPYIPEHSREYFFRAPSRTGLNHSLFNPYPANVENLVSF